MDLAPSFLISVPQLRDPNFDHSVVLLLEHDDAGSMGLVINRETDHSMSDFCALQDLEYRGTKVAKVLFGGPVGTTQGFLLYGAPLDLSVDRQARRVDSGIWFGSDMDLLATLARQTNTPYRLLVGYAGWAPGQLESEIGAGAWIPRPVDSGLLFHTPAGEIWARALGDLGIDPRTIVRGDRAVN
jgi:putative transcriptional regulator